MTNGFLGLPWFVWGLACLGVAVLYFFIWPRPHPERRRPRPGWANFVLRWFHSLTWILLAGACFLWSAETLGIASWCARLALAAYLLFVGVAVWDRRANQPHVEGVKGEG